MPPQLPHEFSALDENMFSFNEEFNAFFESKMSSEWNFPNSFQEKMNLMIWY